MALFEYVALSNGGKKEKGILDADTFEGARDLLIESGIVVTKLYLLRDSKRTSLDRNSLIRFTQDLANLLLSKLPLYESLLTIEEKYRSHKNHALFLDLADLVKGGKSLSKALSCYPKTFNPIYIALVRSGENTGALDKAFEELYRILAKEDKFRRDVRSALIYPTFLLSFSLVIMTVLFLFLIPTLKELFEGRKLQPLTQFVLNMSDLFSRRWPLIFSLLMIIIGGGIFLFRIEKTKNFLKTVALKIPIIKSIMVESILMRFSRVLASLLGGGVTIVEALKLAKESMHHPVYERAISSVEEGIIAGKQLSFELKKTSLFPPMMIRMLATSEEVGNSDVMLEHIALIYEETLEKTLTQFTNLLQPVMLLFLGILIGATILSVLLPLTDMSGLTM